jgi:hypothetical protein
MDFFNELINYLLKKNINTISTNQIMLFSTYFNYINKVQTTFEKTYFTEKKPKKKVLIYCLKTLKNLKLYN